MSSPVDGGTFNDPSNISDGANEFTFSADTPGVLKLKFKVRKPDLVDQSATDQAKYTFDVDAIGSSVLTWPDANSGGKAIVSGEYLTATATFTGLPQNNTDFGTKTVRLMYDGNEVAEQKFEVFFMRNESNHPGNGAGTDSNWFYYWRQAAGAQNVNLVYNNAVLSPTRNYAKTPGILDWDWAAAQDKTQIIFYKGILTYGDSEYGANSGASLPTGIDAFFGVLLHEQRHVWQIAQADALLGSLIVPGTPWQYGWSWNTDTWNGLNTNHYTPGADSLPGVAGYDDNNDGMIDNLPTNGRGELGRKLAQIARPPEGINETDDVALGSAGPTESTTSNWPASQDWPAAWPVPTRPTGCRDPHYIEWDAINAGLAHKQDQNASDDWGNPGKQHDTKAYDD